MTAEPGLVQDAL